MDATSTLAGHPLVPVVVIQRVADAAPLAEALLAAGIGALEVTLRTDAALPALAAVARRVPDMLVGAGSVRRAEQFAQIADAGARFAVSPGATASLLDAAERQGMPFVPGAVTASEIIGLLESGYRLQKFFPAEASGGLASIRALAAPLPEVLFFPTGGIDQTLAREYLACECVASVGGSWFVPAGALAAGDFARIRELASDARTVAMQVRPLLTDG